METSSTFPHLSAFDLDRLVFGHLPSDVRDQAHAHVAICGLCRDERDARAGDATHFDREIFARTLPAVLRRASTAPAPRRLRPRTTTWLTGAGIALAAAAAFVLWARGVRSTQDDDQAATLQTKGDFDLLVYARTGGVIKTLDRYDQTVNPGSELRFVLAGTPPDMHHAFIASVDTRGEVSIYFPYGGTTSAPVPSAGRWEAPGSIVLDGSLGPERVFAILSKDPLDVAEVRAALAQVGKNGPDAVRDTQTVDLPGTRQRSFLLLKQGADSR